MRDQKRQLISTNRQNALWLSGAFCLILFAWFLTWLSDLFGYDWAVIDMPIVSLTALLLTASSVFFAAVVLITRGNERSPFGSTSMALIFVIIVGLAARFVVFASEPALEDDYQRYFWDGAVTASGASPYKTPPKDVLYAGSSHPLAELAQQSGPVLERINHNELTTIYPPLSQLAFAIAYGFKPFSLASWRSVILFADIATLALILVLLAHLGQSLSWSAIYWWNPIVLKEFFNSAHMDALVLPFVLGALYLALKARPFAATVALAFAIGTKVWPVLLAPLLWRQSVRNARQLLICAIILCAFCALWVSPYLAAGLGETSGALSYAQRWTINSPLFTTLRDALRWIFLIFLGSADAAQWGSTVARGTMALAAGLVALAVCATPIKGAKDFLTRALVVIAALIFLSPAIYPWYTLWMAPLLALVPQMGLLLLYVTIPLYYTYFFFTAREMTHFYQNGMVWIVWVPVWLMCLMTWRSAAMNAPGSRRETERSAKAM